MKIKKIIFILFLVLTITILAGCNEKSNDDLINDKINSELEYLESNITSITKKYISGNYYLTSDSINWNEISKDFSFIENSYDVMLIDLASKQIDRKKILQLENNINKTAIIISEQDDTSFLGSVCDIYSTIPDILSDFNQSQTLIKTKQLKSNLLYAQYFCEVNDFIKAYEYVNIAENLYNEIIEKREYLEENSYKINKNYIKIQEMKKAVEDANLYEFSKEYLESLEWF